MLGYHRDDGRDGISALAAAGVRRAERLAADGAGEVVVVVCSGFARDGDAPEGELMRAAWRGPAVPVVAETEARDTVENAVRSLPLLRAYGVDVLDVVCAASHAPRVRALLPRYFGRRGIRVRVRPFWRPFPPRRLWWELRGLRWLPAFRRRLDAAE